MPPAAGNTAGARDRQGMTMSMWYYADARNERQGPVSAIELVRLRLQGALGWESLVWRDGMGEWQPMRDFAGELAQADDRGPALLSTSDGAVLPPDATAGFGTSSAAAEPLSPYAPPTAAVSSNAAIVLGGEVVYAGFWKRFAALTIDGFVTAIASWIIQIPLFILAGVGGAFGGDPFATGGSIAVIVFSYLVSIAIPLFYSSWMHASSHQATLGKMAVGIKVCRTSGERISFLRAMGRYFAQIPSALILGIGYLMAGFTERKQALHDMIGDTLVVDRWAFTDRPDLQRPELGVVTWVVIIIGGGIIGLAVLAIVAAIAIPALTR